MERLEAKLIAILVSFIVPLAFTLLPHKIGPWVASRGPAGEKFLSCLMCFGGGIFFGTFLLHMATEARDILYYNLLVPYNIYYPVTDLIIGAGFFFVFYLEKIVVRITKKGSQEPRKDADETCDFCQRLGHICDSCRTKDHPGSGQINDGREIDDDFLEPSKSELDREVKDGKADRCVEGSREVKSAASNDEEHHHSHYDFGENGSHHLRSLILITALSLHHIFEGLAIGLQLSAGSTFAILLAVMCHESIVGFSLGLQLVKCQYTTKRTFIVSACYSFILPLGVAIGTILSEIQSRSNVMDIVNGVVQAFSTGTFVYITFFEILAEEIKTGDHSLTKVSSAAFGFVVASCLLLMEHR